MNPEKTDDKRTIEELSHQLEAQPPLQDEGTDLPELDPGERESVLGIFAALDKALRIVLLYPANNKIYIHFTDELTERFLAFLKEYTELNLLIREEEILYKGHVVYREPSSARSLSMKLYRDGIRRLVLYEGLNKEELLDLLSVLTAQAAPDDLEDDMVTLLWSKDFSHITYFVIDELTGETEDPSLDLSKHPNRGDEGANLEGAKEEKDKLPAPKVSKGSLSAVLTITDHDLRTIRTTLARDRARNLRHDLTTLLFEMLQIRNDLEPFRNSVRVLGLLARSYALSGNLTESVEILRNFREHCAAGLPLTHEEIIEREIRAAGSEEVLEQLGELLEQPVFKGENDLAAYLKMLGPEILDSLLEILPRSRNSQVLGNLLLDLGRQAPGKLLERLSDPNPAVVQQIVTALGQLDDPTLSGHILAQLDHHATQVRLETVKALGRLGGQNATRGLLRAIRDPEYQVRIHALRSIEEHMEVTSIDAHKDVTLMPALIEILEDREGVSRNRYERQEFFCTIARVGGPQAVPYLKKTIEKGSWLKRAKNDENRACAAAALGYVKSPQAVELLERHAKSSSDPVQEACRMALRRLVQDDDPSPEE